MKSRDGKTNVGAMVIVALLVAGLVFGLVQHGKYKKKQEFEARRQLEEERARQEKAEAERKAEEERVRREKEEQEAKRRREREEREARIERERQERLQKEREAEEARRKAAAEIEAARTAYRRARDAFGAASVEFYADASNEKKVGMSGTMRWYVDESFASDRRIYEITGATEVLILFPDKPPQVGGSTAVIPSLETKPGFLADGTTVWICGTGESVKTCAVPDNGKDFMPLDCELADFLDIALALGVNPPKKRYRVTLQRKDDGKVMPLGVFDAADSVPRAKIEETVRDVLNRKAKRGAILNKPPTPKKTKRTVVFYDGDIVKKDMRGVTHIPREFVHLGTSTYGWKDHTSIENARRNWERLRDIAQKEEEEELEIAAQNRVAQEEYERKLGADAAAATGSAAIEAYLADCELFVEREMKNGHRTSATKKQKETKPSKAKSEPRSSQKSEPQTCYKCYGKGSVTQRVREKCDECGGDGVTEIEIKLENKRWADGWNRTTKKSTKREACQKCRRSGRISVEKDVECPVCHGSGMRE